MIETATKQDLPVILDIYKYARDFMRRSGNPSQWANGNPQKETLLNDIRKKQLYLCRDGAEIYGVFAFIIGVDETYLRIADGAWLSETPYGAIHRVAASGARKGVLAEAVSFCQSKISHLRIDTHHDNLIMRHLLPTLGFQRCGIIYLPDGSPRIAYELTAPDSTAR